MTTWETSKEFGERVKMRVCEIVDKIYEAYPTPVSQDEFVDRMRKIIRRIRPENDTTSIRISDLDYVRLDITHDLADTHLSHIEKMAKRLGWFVHYKEEYEGYPNPMVYVVFNPQGRKVPVTSRWLYHVTSGVNTESIKKRGLIPSRAARDYYPGMRYHGRRIHLFDNFYDIKKILRVMPTAHDIVIFRVDTNKLKNFSFYDDIELIGNVRAVWTDKIIPPKAIEYMGKLDEIV